MYLQSSRHSETGILSAEDAVEHTEAKDEVCHRFPVRCLGGELTGGAQAYRPGYHRITPSGFRNESLWGFIFHILLTPKELRDNSRGVSEA